MNDIRDSLAQVQELKPCICGAPVDQDECPYPTGRGEVSDGRALYVVTCINDDCGWQAIGWGADGARKAWNSRHGAGDAEAWRSMDDVPPHDRKDGALGKEYLIWPVPSSGERTAFFGRRLGGKARWYKYGAPVHGVTHWRPLPAPPDDDAARAGERG